MDIAGISSSTVTPSTQKVTQVANRVEGGNPEDSTVKVSNDPAVDVSKEQVSAQIEQVNSTLESMGQTVRFGLDDSSNTMLVKVVDKSTDELIRQLPSEESLKVMQNIQDFLSRMQNTEGYQSKSLTGSLINEII